jgi:hypothetical protein
MIDRRLERYWAAVRTYRIVLRTPEQRRLWLDRVVGPLLGEAASPRVLERVAGFLAEEGRPRPVSAEVTR